MEKKSNFAGFAETNSQRKRPISREFSGQIHQKANKKAKKDPRKKKWKDSRKKILEGCQIQGKKERKHKSSSSTVVKATVLVSSDKKNISFTETLGRLTSFNFMAENSNVINFFSLLALVLLCSLQGKIVRNQKFKSICEVKIFFQSADSSFFHAREMRQWQRFLHCGQCPVFHTIIVRTPSKFCYRSSDKISR